MIHLLSLHSASFPDFLFCQTRDSLKLLIILDVSLIVLDIFSSEKGRAGKSKSFRPDLFFEMEIEIQVSYRNSRRSVADCGPALYTLLETSHRSSKLHRSTISLSKEFSHLDEGKRRGRGETASWRTTLNFETPCFWNWELDFELLSTIVLNFGVHKKYLADR